MVLAAKKQKRAALLRTKAQSLRAASAKGKVQAVEAVAQDSAVLEEGRALKKVSLTMVRTI